MGALIGHQALIGKNPGHASPGTNFRVQTAVPKVCLENRLRCPETPLYDSDTDCSARKFVCTTRTQIAEIENLFLRLGHNLRCLKTFVPVAWADPELWYAETYNR